MEFNVDSPVTEETRWDWGGGLSVGAEALFTNALGLQPPWVARAWRLKMALRQVCAQARRHASIKQAGVDRGAWLSWTRRSRLAPFKRLAATRFAAAPAWKWT